MPPLLPRSFEEAPDAAVQGWLGRYPQGVEFMRFGPVFDTSHPSPIYVRPQEPEHEFPSPFGFDSWAEYYRPTPAMMRQAIFELAGMLPLSGDAFFDSVDSFERRFGPIAQNAQYLQQLGDAPMHNSVAYIWRILGDRVLASYLPLWCYKREARILHDTLALYQSVRAGDTSGPSDWKGAWWEVLRRIHPYLRFVGYGTDWREHVDKSRATSPDNLIPFIPKQQLMADNLLGAIYIHVLQAVLEQQLVRTCVARGCNRTFLPARSDQVYCTSSCASSERSRRLREKQRAAKG